MPWCRCVFYLVRSLLFELTWRYKIAFCTPIKAPETLRQSLRRDSRIYLVRKTRAALMPQTLSAQCCPVSLAHSLLQRSLLEHRQRFSAASRQLGFLRCESKKTHQVWTLASAALLVFAPRVFVETLSYFDGLLLYRISIRYQAGHITCHTQGLYHTSP